MGIGTKPPVAGSTIYAFGTPAGTPVGIPVGAPVGIAVAGAPKGTPCPCPCPVGALTVGTNPGIIDCPGASCTVLTVPSTKLYTPPILSELRLTLLLTVLLTVVTLVTTGMRLPCVTLAIAAKGSLLLSIAYWANGFREVPLGLTEAPVIRPLLARALRVLRTDYGMLTVVFVVVFVWVEPP